MLPQASIGVAATIISSFPDGKGQVEEINILSVCGPPLPVCHCVALHCRSVSVWPSTAGLSKRTCFHAVSCEVDTIGVYHETSVFLGAETVSYVMYVCVEHLGCYWADFHEIWYLRILRKSETLTCHINLTRTAGTYEYLRVCTFMWV